MYLATETFYFEFSTYNASGALTNADSTPTGILVINNADQAASGSTLVTITNSATGVYKGSVGLTAANVTGSEFYVRVTAIVGGVTAKQCTATQKIERITGDGFAGLGFVGETVFATDLLPETTKTDAYLPVTSGASVYTSATYAGPVPDDADAPIIIYKGLPATIGPLVFTDYDGDITHGASVTLRILPLDTYRDDATYAAAVEKTATASLVAGTLTLTFTLTGTDTSALTASSGGDGSTLHKAIAALTAGGFPVMDRECVVRRWPVAVP